MRGGTLIPSSMEICFLSNYLNFKFMKKIILLLLFIVGGLASVSNKNVFAQRDICCFNTVLPGYVCFTYILVQPDGSSTVEGVAGIRIPCPQI